MKKVRDKYKMTELGEIPSEWHIEVLGECSNVTKLAGFEFTEYIEYIDDGEIIALRALNLKNGKLNLEDIKKIDKKVSESLTRSKLYINDVLFSYVGTVGEVALIEENDKFHLAPNVAKLTFNDSVVPKFALQYLMSSNMRNEINRYVTTTSQPALSMENIRKLKIIVPKKEEQEKISFILSTVDEQIDNVDALIEKNKELKKGLMQTLLTKGIGHTKFKKTEIGEIPEEWDVKKLECVFEILDSMRKPIKASDREKIEGNIPYYGASGVIDWINDYIFDEELILLGEDGENLNSRNSDLAFKISGKTWVNNHAHVFRVINKKECNIDFMVYYLEAKDYSIYIAGSAQPKITQAQCRKFLLPLPEKQEQDKIASILLESDKKIEEYENKKQKLEELKKGLMQQLLTGMIRVTV